MVKEITIYTSSTCGFCFRAKQLLRKKGVAFTEYCIDGRPDLRREMMQKSGRTTVPQIWIAEYHVGGCDDLYALERAGKLDSLLNIGQ